MQTRETDSLDEAQNAAFELACRGWTTWVYAHDHRPTGVPGFGESRASYRGRDEPEYHTVAQYEPGGRRVR